MISTGYLPRKCKIYCSLIHLHYLIEIRVFFAPKDDHECKLGPVTKVEQECKFHTVKGGYPPNLYAESDLFNITLSYFCCLEVLPFSYI